MPWWGWIVVGVALIGSELALVDAGFYLVFLGVSALAVGLADFAGMGGPIWIEWAAFGVLSVGSMLFFRGRVYDRLRAGVPDPEDALIGEIAEVNEDIAAGSRGQVALRGSVWTARNEADVALAMGSRARVVSAEGVELRIRPVD